MPCQSLLMKLTCWWVHRVLELLTRNSITLSNGQKTTISKTKELIISRPRSKAMLESSQPFIGGAERVSMLRVMGVMLNSMLSMSEHVSQVLSVCASSIFALRLLRTNGLNNDQLHLVARATTVGSIMY